MVLFSLLSLVALVIVRLQLVTGGAKLQQRLRPRLEQLRISQYYTFAFSIYWAVVGATYGFMYVRYEVMGLRAELPVRLFFAAALGLLGTVDAAVWFFVRSGHTLETEPLRGGRLIAPPEAALAREDDLSDALRHEFVKHTIMGIVNSTRTVNAEAAVTSPAYRANAIGSIGEEGGLTPMRRPLLAQQENATYNGTRGGGGLADFDPLIPHLTRGHFSERHTLELAPGIYFQDFAPMVWQALRQEVYGVSFTRYLRSLMGRSTSEMESFIEAMVGNFSEGKSGSFVVFSADKQYILKTLSRKEQRQLLRMLPRYYEHMRDQPRSLLSRYYGTYCITMHSQTIFFVVMESLYFGSRTIHERYDLKGSWVDRHRRSEANATGLDGDLRRKLNLPPELRAQLLEQSERDTELLRSLHIMDYSLLLGIHSPDGSEQPWEGMTPGATPRSMARASATTRSGRNRGPLLGPLSSRNRGGFGSEESDPSEPKPDEIYYVTIIDLLQRWDLSKRLERAVKVLLCCRCASAPGMSAIDPLHYARRFTRMIDRVSAK